MISNQFKPYLPHLAALLLFVGISLAYFLPVVEGKVLPQGDNTHARGAAQELVDYELKTGENSMWTNSMFGGMPAYQIKADSSKNLFRHLNRVSRLGLPYTTAAMLFLYLSGFYVLLISLRMNPWLAATGAIAFALGSYNLIIILAGHITKAYAIALMAPVLAGVLYAFNRNRWLGGFFTAVALGLEIAYNHIQITYYLLLLILILGLVKLYFAWRDKALQPFSKTIAVLALAVILAILPNITMLWTTYEYGKFTNRGQSELQGAPGEKSHSGLDKEYALSWSYGIHETLTLLIPNAVGGASEPIGADNHAVQQLNGQVKEIVAGQSKYWGGRVFTSGPVYAGAVVCFLFFLGLFYYKGREKWWLLLGTLFSILLAWGKNFEPLTNLMFYYFPFYNKFRTVEMALVIASLTIPLLGFLGLKEVLDRPNLIREQSKKFLAALGLTGGLSLLLYLAPTLFYGFLAPQEAELFAYESTGEMAQGYAAIEQGLKGARIELFRADALRSVLFIFLASASLWFFAQNKISARYLTAGLALLILIDLWGVDKRYLHNDQFITPSKARQEFAESNADRVIHADKNLDFRVFALYLNPFNEVFTSYHHKSIGGYHGAKLRRYQDVIDAYLQKEWSMLTGALRQNPNPNQITELLAQTPVLNMLNTKYLIYHPQANPIQNPHAMGAAWMVTRILPAQSPGHALDALVSIDLAHEAVMEPEFGNKASVSPSNSTSTRISMTSYAPNKLEYKVDGTKGGLAVFSEIYYPAGWSATIDGQPVEILRANYILRALQIPDGAKHIEFRFEPQSFRWGQILSIIGSLAVVLAAGFFIWSYRKGTLTK